MPGHSAIVEMDLYADGRSFKVAQSGDHFLLLRESATIEPGEARLVLKIDGIEEVIDFEIASPVNGERVEVVTVGQQSEVAAV